MTDSIQKIVLGGGCFWCLEAAYQEIEGIETVVSGYAGGHDGYPTYERVVGGRTGHAEVVQVSFDASVIGLADILDIFWIIHNPTTPNRQGYDIGDQYRSIILYEGNVQKAEAEASRDRVAKLWDDAIVTQIEPLVAFYPAEDYHQNYFRSNPERAYCQAIINPKLKHLREAFAGRLKRA